MSSSSLSAASSAAKSSSSKDSKSSKNGFSQFEVSSLAAHNKYRKRHQAPPLELNVELCKMAQAHANELGKIKDMEHSDIESRTYLGDLVGENLAFKASTEKPTMSAQDAPSMWYSEIKDYNFKKPEFKIETGHFTQLVWCDTKQLGIGRVKFTKDEFNHILVVARYWPTGNVIGEFEENVLRARKDAPK